MTSFPYMYILPTDQCDINNGGCDQICANGGQCQCSTGYRLGSDGRSCNGEIIQHDQQQLVCIAEVLVETPMQFHSDVHIHMYCVIISVQT